MSPKQVDSNFRVVGDTVFCDITGYTPNSEIYFDIRSKAVDPNTSTLGVTAGVHTTTDANGACTFHAPKDYLLPDTPRSLQAFGPIDVPQVFS